MRHRLVAPATLAFVVAVIALAAGACGADDDQPAASAETSASATGDGSGIRVVTPEAGAAIIDDPPPGLVVLDVRTAEEFAGGHLTGADMLDFYRDDFADRLAELDRDVPYLIYCRSGNRSGQTRALMEELGFADVVDVDGGIVAWDDAGLPIDG